MGSPCVIMCFEIITLGKHFSWENVNCLIVHFYIFIKKVFVRILFRLTKIKQRSLFRNLWKRISFQLMVTFQSNINTAQKETTPLKVDHCNVQTVHYTVKFIAYSAREIIFAHLDISCMTFDPILTTLCLNELIYPRFQKLQ